MYRTPPKQRSLPPHSATGVRTMVLLAILVAAASAVAQEETQEPELPLFDILMPEEDQEDAPETTDPAAQPIEFASRFEARMGFLDLVEAKDYDAAIPVGVRMVELTGEEYGVDSNERAIVLADLAEIRRRAGEHEQAEIDFLGAIATISGNEGNLSRMLIQPLIGLGANYQDMDEHMSALSAFTEARTVNRRSYGLLNEDQIPVLDRMTDSYIALGRYREADEKQLDALRLLERTEGYDTPGILPAVYKYARWLRAQGRFEEERLFYMRAMNIIKQNFGRDSIQMVPPLRETGNSFRVQKFPEGLGASSLKRALEIVENMEEPDPLVRAETLRDLGDWYAAFSKVGRGGQEYRASWEALGELDNGDELREAWYAQPKFVLYEIPSQRGLRPEGSEPGLEQGFVLVSFDVTPEGRTDNVQVVDADPPGKKDEAILRSMRRSRFRPRIVDGEVVRADKLARKFTFSFKPSG